MTDQKPAVDPTQLTPEQWQQYLTSARTALHKNPKDREALQAIRDANFALGVYDEAAAASPGERVEQGVREGVKGIGRAALDIPVGIATAALHPIQTVKNLPKVPGALIEGISSDDPQTVARTVGNIGSLLLPFAKTGRLAGAPAAVGRFARAVTPPIVRSVATKVTPPFVTEALGRLTAPRPPAPTQLPGLLGVGDDLGAVPTQPPPVASVTNTPPLTARPRPPLPTGGPLDAAAFLRRASPPQGTPGLLNPLQSLGSVQMFLKMTAKEFQAVKAQLAPEVWNELARLRAAH